MADVTIGQLPVAPTVNGAFEFPVSNGSETQKATLSQVVGLIPTPQSIPTGVIVMWSGSVVSIPSGWALCNGANGTPNLTNRFVVAAGGHFTPGNLGGNNITSLAGSNVSVANSSHSHTYFYCTVQCGPECLSYNCGGTTGTTSLPTGTTTVFNTTTTSLSTVPLYYALAFIMKL